MATSRGLVLKWMARLGVSSCFEATGCESDCVTPSSRENGNPRQDVVLENPALYYSAVKKDKHNLRKKVVRHQRL